MGLREDAVPVPGRVRGREPVLLRLVLQPLVLRLSLLELLPELVLRLLRGLRVAVLRGVRVAVLLRWLRWLLPPRLLLLSRSGGRAAASSNAAVAQRAVMLPMGEAGRPLRCGRHRTPNRRD